MQRLTNKRIYNITDKVVSILSTHENSHNPIVFSLGDFGFKYIPSKYDADHLCCWYADASNVNVIMPYDHPEPGVIAQLIRGAFNVRGV